MTIQRTVELPDDLAQRLDHYLQEHPDETLSSLVMDVLEMKLHPRDLSELSAIDVGDGILLKPKKPFLETTLAQVAGCLKYKENPKSLDELEDAIRLGVMEQWHDRS